MTQEQFAAEFNIPLGTLRDWEQERAEPDATARAYLGQLPGMPRLLPRHYALIRALLRLHSASPRHWPPTISSRVAFRKVN
jgi:hypothetical protein